MATIQKTLSTKKDANNMVQVMLRIINGRSGKRIRLKSGVFVPGEYWSDTKSNITIPKKIDADLKRDLQSRRDKLEEVERLVLKLVEFFGNDADKEVIESTMSILEGYEGVITNDVITRKLAESEKKEERNEKDIYYLAKIFLDRSNLSQARISAYRIIFRSMTRFEMYRNVIVKKSFTWNIDEVTQEDIELYFEYMENEHEISAMHPKEYEKVASMYDVYFMPKYKIRDFQERGTNRMIGIKKCAKSFWNWMLKNEYTTNNPFTNYSVGAEKYGVPYYLTIDERNAIITHDFSNNRRLERQRDIFVFQCFVGCRVSDLVKLTKDNIINGMLVYTPQKTHNEDNAVIARVPLKDNILALLQKYEGVDEYGRLMPFGCEYQYNHAIKEILTECGITRKVNVRDSMTGETVIKPLNEIASSHMARRTFIGNIYNEVQDPNIIGCMSGHKEGSKAFNRYRNIGDDVLRDVINNSK